MTSTTLLPPVPTETIRNGQVENLMPTLQDQRAKSIDVVMPTSDIRSHNGHIMIGGLDNITVPAQPARIFNDGVHPEVPAFEFDPSGLYKAASGVFQNLADIDKIPVRYLRKIYTEDTELFDITINRHHDRAEGKKLVRTFYGSDPRDGSVVGHCRAILSDRFDINYDLYDTALALFQGLMESGLDASNVKSFDLSESRLFINIEAEEIAVHGRSLIKNYRSPFTGQTGAEMPLVHAGIKFSNSEVGRGAFQLKPYAVFRTCGNGATIDAHALRRIHLGKTLDQGEIKWSGATVKAANELVRNQVRDAVSTFMTTDFLDAAITEWEKDAGVEVAQPVDVIKVVAKELTYTEAEADLILADFIKGGQLTSGGIGHAVTSVAQRIEDPDRAHEFGETHATAMAIAAREGSRA